MLSDMLKLENIRFTDRVCDWKEAIHLSLKPLISGGFITENYEKAILKNTIKYGPYYVLADEFALIHGRPTDGVLQKQLAITLLQEPVKFSKDGYQARVLIALAVRDSNSHIDTMKVLSNIFMDESKVNQVLQATNSEQIYNMLIQLENKI